ncbi:unnamed protein product [Sympodiomycopsis kandeliae]
MSSGNNAGQSFGDAVKGVFNTAHGAGESIRGNFNNFVDQAGEGLASQMGDKNEQAEREQKLAQSGSSSKPGENANIAEKGKEEMTRGLNQISGNGSQQS